MWRGKLIFDNILLWSPNVLVGKRVLKHKKTAVCLILRGLQLTILVFFVGRVEGSEFGTW